VKRKTRSDNLSTSLAPRMVTAQLIFTKMRTSSSSSSSSISIDCVEHARRMWLLIASALVGMMRSTDNRDYRKRRRRRHCTGRERLPPAMVQSVGQVRRGPCLATVSRRGLAIRPAGRQTSLPVSAFRVDGLCTCSERRDGNISSTRLLGLGSGARTGGRTEGLRLTPKCHT